MPVNTPRFYRAELFYVMSVVAICLFFTFSHIFDLLQIHVYRHDSAYYTSIESYSVNLRTEGRWVNYFIFPFYSSVPGKVAILLDLTFFYLFSLLVSYRWTKNIVYAALLAMLFIQVPPLTGAILWPATILPAFFFLFLAVVVAPYMSIYMFYPLFGIILLGSAGSNLYYLLPLVHLANFEKPSLSRNSLYMFTRLLPVWATGFIIGYLALIVMTYVISGQAGITIASWRGPNYVENIQDLLENTLRSIKLLISHTEGIFATAWFNYFMLLTLVGGIYSVKKEQYVPLFLLSVCIISAHYVIILPIGIYISFRTIIATYIGVLVILFYHFRLKRVQCMLLMPLIVIVMFSFHRANHASLAWYNTITSVYFDELVGVVPEPPGSYKGIAFLSSTEDVQRINSIIQEDMGVSPTKNIESLDGDHRWAPVGRETGFEKVLICNTWDRKKAVCEMAMQIAKANARGDQKISGLYDVPGVADGFLIISLNTTDWRR